MNQENFSRLDDGVEPGWECQEDLTFCLQGLLSAASIDSNFGLTRHCPRRRKEYRMLATKAILF